MKAQMKFQKIICLVMLIVGALCFVSAVGLCTTIYDLLYVFCDRVDGANIFYDIQPFNNQFMIYALIMILAAVALYVTMTHKRRRYYVANIVCSTVVAVVDVVLSALIFVGLLKYKAQFLAVDFETLKKWIEEIYKNIKYTESTFYFDVAMVMCALVVAASILLIVNLVWKLKIMKKEDKLLGGKYNPDGARMEVVK